ncbi:MAG: hypothetical protein AB9866_16095 [Syntrophobacteraceae bacterium]
MPIKEDIQKTRMEIWESLGELAESIMLMEQPFDYIGIIPEVMSYYYLRYKIYYNELNDSFKHQILKKRILKAKWLLHTQVFKEHKPIQSLFANYIDTDDVFLTWIKEREANQVHPIMAGYPPYHGKLRTDQISKQIIKQRMPEFKYHRQSHFPGLRCFSKPILQDNAIIVGLEKGSVRRAISLYLGLERPCFAFDIACLFSSGQSLYWYNSPEDLAVALNRAIDLASLILPEFESRMKKVLSA